MGRTTDGLDRAAERIARLAAEPVDLVTLWRAATAVLADAVPHYAGPCWYSLDPASLLITSHFQEGLTEFPSEWLMAEYYADDVNHLVDVARSATGLTTLHDATGGDPSGSERWRQNRAMGADQELIVALRTRSGEAWGALGLYREPDRPLFSAAEQRFLCTVAPSLAAGVQRALLVGEATDPDGPEAPGLLILTEKGDVESATPGTDRWLAELADGPDPANLPVAVRSVAARAPGVVRVRTRSGRWVVLHGAPLVTDGRNRVAVIVEPAHPARVFPLLVSAYGLTSRETDVTRLVLEGASTAEIAAALHVSPHTVQQHLKSVFDKTGVRSRRDLVGRIFFAHYEPRFRDNEHRVARGAPIRGGPAADGRGPGEDQTAVPPGGAALA